MSTKTRLPSFSLHDMQGRNYDFPNGKTSLLCFVKEDCPTCQLSLPLIEIIQKTFSSVVEVLLIGQDHAGNS